MAEEQKPAAGGVAEIDYDKLGAAISKALAPAVSTAVSEANKPLHEMLGKLSAPAADPAPAKAEDGKPKAFTIEDVGKLLDTKLSQLQSNSKREEERKGYVGSKLKDLPAAYQNQLGSDPAKWPEEEQKIREQFKADFKGLGGKVDPVGGENPGGAAPAKVVDVSKLSPTGKIEAGLVAEKAAKTSGTAAT